MVRPVGILALLLALGCASGESTSEPTPITQPPAPGRGARVLMLTATAGFRHDSIPAARQVMATMAASGGFSVSATEDLSLFKADTLRNYDVVMFALTSGELPFSAVQKSALVDFVSSGHGFIGIHSATDTLYEWPDYGRLVGAYFKEHPWTQQGSVVVESPSHPASGGLAERFSITEEFYTFEDNPRGRVDVLLRLDPASVGATGDYPLAWAHAFGAGRAYYNALGHFPETWRDARFQRLLASAVAWTSGR